MKEQVSKNNEQELTLDEQLNLAKELERTVSDRNRVLSQYPDFDDLTVFVDGSPDNRKLIEELEKAANEARKRFDDKVANKLWFVKHLRETGEEELANMIDSMFGLEKLRY